MPRLSLTSLIWGASILEASSGTNSPHLSERSKSASRRTGTSSIEMLPSVIGRVASTSVVPSLQTSATHLILCELMTVVSNLDDRGYIDFDGCHVDESTDGISIELVNSGVRTEPHYPRLSCPWTS